MNNFKKLEKLPDVLEKIKPMGLADMALIIKKPNQSLKEITKSFPRKNLEIFHLNKNIISDDFLKKLIEIFEKKKWLLIELKDDFMTSQIYGQLRLLSINNRLQIFDLIGLKQAEINIRQPKESRIIFVTTNEILEKLAEAGFNRFLNLFGLVIRLAGGEDE